VNGQRVTRDASAGIEEALKPPNSAQVPFMITLAQKEQLRNMGYSDADIVNMTPEQAHKVLGVLPPLPY
jgi:hypothetical protein